MRTALTLIAEALAFAAGLAGLCALILGVHVVFFVI